jgi:hypothetical protein
MILNCRSFGEFTAQALGDAHERDPNTNLIDIYNLDVAMDLYNNKKGLEIYRNSWDINPNPLNELTKASYINRVMKYLNDGELRYINAGTLTPTNQ